MKKFSHCLVLTTIIGSASLLGTGAAYGNPQIVTQQAAALSAPETTDPGDATIGLHQIVRVPTPAEITPVSTGQPGNAIVPPLEITAAEARQWVVDAGYSNVSELSLATTAEGAPVYRGTAMADGRAYAVIVDSWGNIAGWQ